MTRSLGVSLGVWGVLGCVALGLGVGCDGEDAARQVAVTPEEDAALGGEDADAAGGEDAAAEEVGADAPPDVAFEPACSLEDPLAPNYAPGEARTITSDFTQGGLYLCPETSDWYAVEASAGQTLVVRADFNPGFGDMELYAYGPGGQGRAAALASSARPFEAESVRFEAPSDGFYYVEVASVEGSQTAYALTVRVACGPGGSCPEGRACSLVEGLCAAEVAPSCGADAGYEPNESAASATPLTLEGGAAEVGPLGICPADEDYFRVTVGPESGVEVTLRHATDNAVEVYLFDASGRPFGQGSGGAGVKVLKGYALPAGEYLVVVHQPPASDATSTRYTLEVREVAGGCASDVECTGVASREFCDVASGRCVGLEAEGTQGLLEACDDDGDCAPGAAGCYEGSPGAGDNSCTIFCAEDAECAALAPGSYCIFHEELRGQGICAPPCSSDLACSFAFRCDEAAGRCVSRGCTLDAACPEEGETCIHQDEREGGLCLLAGEPTSCGAGAAPDGASNGSSSLGAALEVGEAGEAAFEGLLLCDADEDWYTLELTAPSSTVRIAADFARSLGADVDIYVYDAQGALHFSGVSPDRRPEVAYGEFLSAGRYFVRLNQYPGGRGDVETPYSLSLQITPSDCRMEARGCQQTSPLRLACDEERGACVDFEGNGEVALGGLCDTSDDCTPEAALCFTYLGAANEANICTRYCERGQDTCADVPGTRCYPISRTLGLCIKDPG